MHECQLFTLLFLSVFGESVCPEGLDAAEASFWNHRSESESVVERNSAAEGRENVWTSAPEIPDDGRASARGDLARLGGATMLYAVLWPDVRRPLYREASLSRVVSHFRHPIRSAVEGAREDQDPFFTNFVAHPLTWGSIGYYLRSRGHSSLSSLLMSQGHSIFWEYVLEGTYQKPSGADLITNLVSATLGIVLADRTEGDRSGLSLELSAGPVGHASGREGPRGQRGIAGEGLKLTFRVGR